MFKTVAPGIGLLALVMLAGLIYAPGLGGVLILDDYLNLAAVGELDSGHWSWGEVMHSNGSGPLGRPVAMLSFIIDYLTGGGDIHVFKTTNLGLHLLCVVFIFWLGGRLFGQYQSTRPYRWWLALWMSAMWCFSPLYVSTVLYVVQRMAQLATLFSLLGLLLYVMGRQAMAHSYPRGIGLIAAGLLVCWPLATLSKENGALLPLLLLVTELYWFRFDGDRRTRQFLKYLFVSVVGLPAMAALFMAAAHPEWILRDYAYRDFTLTERLLTEPRILWNYSAALLYPQGAQMGVFHDDVIPSRGLWSPPATALAMLSWLAVIIMAARARANWLGLALSGMVFFLAAHLLEATVFPLELYYEHRNYLPGVGVYLSCATGAALLLPRITGRRLLLMGIFLTLLPVAFAVATYQRVLTWSSWDNILLTTAASHPDSRRAHAELVNWYALRGDENGALKQIGEIERLNDGPDSTTALYRMYIHCWTHTPISEESYASLAHVRTLKLNLETGVLLEYLAELADGGRCGQEIDYARLSVVLKQLYMHTTLFRDPLYLRNLHLALGRIFKRAGDKPAALAQLTDAMDALPEHLEAGLIMVRYLIESGDLDSASGVITLLKRRDKTGGIYSKMLEGYKKLIPMIRQIKASRVQSSTGTTPSASRLEHIMAVAA